VDHSLERGAIPHISNSETGALEGNFTAAEITRLVALRQHFQTHPDHGDADAAIRRLEFARWLVQHGKLTDC
jgi:hypothetical protein